MPKRKGYLWEELTTLELCERAVLVSLRNKRKTPYLRHIKEHYKDWGKKIQQIMINGWKPRPPRKRTINEGTSNKVRHLEIPSLVDHMIHTAVVLVLEKHFMRRYYFWSCGSIPGKGQTFAYGGLKKAMKNNAPKYAAEADIRKFYDTCSKEVVMKCLRRIIKDKKFLDFNEMILDQMGGKLSIGFSVSHWYANFVLTQLDNKIKEKFPELRFFRYMDNYVLLGNNKRTLHRAIRLIMSGLEKLGMRMKNDWQVFPTKMRAVRFLSYRFFCGYTLLAKRLMYRISHRLTRAKKHMNAKTAKAVMSYKGILLQCNSYAFRCKYLYPNVDLKICRRLISNDSIRCTLCA